MRVPRRVPRPLLLLVSALVLLPAANSRALRGRHHVGTRDTSQARIVNEGYIPLNDCTAIRKADQLVETGLYRVYPGDTEGEFTTVCNMDLQQNEGWTVIQQRTDNSWSFNRTWKEYRNGFGEFKKNFWLGLYKIRRIIEMGDYELHIVIRDFEGNTSYAAYDMFFLSSEDTKYRLHIGNYNPMSTAGDALSAHNMHPFVTPDTDNDPSREVHCAKVSNSGWWHKSSDCLDSNLNGIWYDAGTEPSQAPDRITWNTLPGGGNNKLIHSTIMAIRKI